MNHHDAGPDHDLGLPAAPPLPAEVRERALRTVLAGIDAPRRRRTGPLAAAAAVVAVTSVAATLTLSGNGAPGDPPGLEQLTPADSPAPISPAPPTTGGDPVTDEALLRCADAVHADGRAADYPPTGRWRVSALLLRSTGGSETAIAIDDAFACFVGTRDVYVTAPRGTPAGTASLAWLTPAQLVVLNPEREPVTLVPAAAASVVPGDPAAPVQLLGFGVSGVNTANYRITVGDSYRGPIPDPVPVAVLVQDR